jgi:hypothetical protein
VVLPLPLRALVAAVLVVVLAGCGTSPTPVPTDMASASRSPVAGQSASPSGIPVPTPGHELYGFVPYWELDDTIADHLAATPLTTIGLFSVTHTSKGALRDTKGYKAITGDVGRRVVQEAHTRGVPVQLVYSSFGSGRNKRLLESPTLQAAVIASLVALVTELGLDGINLDIEVLPAELVPAYGAFVAATREAVRAADPDGQVSASTGAGTLGAGMAAAAAGAGADRIFLMGYDYRTGRSDPGATSPIARRDGDGKPSLQTSLALYAALGVPPERTLLGLPLYGVTWPVAGPVIGAPSTGNGQAWILRRHLDLLTNREAVPLRDDIEMVEVYMLGSDGSIGPPSPEGSPDPSRDPAATGAALDPAAATPAPELDWEAVYVDSPDTLTPKLALADTHGLAGAGFWAVGYERGLPGYTQLMERFRAGELAP